MRARADRKIRPRAPVSPKSVRETPQNKVHAAGIGGFQRSQSLADDQCAITRRNGSIRDARFVALQNATASLLTPSYNAQANMLRKMYGVTDSQPPATANVSTTMPAHTASSGRPARIFHNAITLASSGNFFAAHRAANHGGK